MTAAILDGKQTSQELYEALQFRTMRYSKKPVLAVLLVGDNPASQIYVNAKLKKALGIGFDTDFKLLPQDACEEEVIKQIHNWNENPDINGILVQLPLPKHLDKNKILNTIKPEKDVDGLTTYNSGLFYTGQTPYAVPCTTRGILMLLDRYEIEIEGKHVVVIGRSNLVGKPTAQAFLARNATVTVCHSKTRDLESIIKTADIVISAVGEKIVNGKILKNNCVVVDVGIFRKPDGKISGDVEFESASEVASFISPVPGGVGPMTVIALMYNLFDLYLAQNSNRQ
ncbi:MAG: bifunctional 5,10-methylenetetrahydrofolate dehydrogenase/5,10-methenyltetrahydrofolate cyclohydrolase [Fusobacterium sp.]|nr:bifunctional 5,10-methylenetetrahydrofolate dehydrogenase/5,10-methenyltetrahydrofolate cyclohydrolase [Fusobacterium sp.]